MRTLFTSNSTALASAGSERAFTMPEMMISTTIFVLVITGVIMSHVIGIRMYQLTQAKLGAGDQARLVLNKMTEDVRGAKRIRIGNSTGDGDFTEISMGSLQRGNSVLIYPSTNYSQFIQYRMDSASGNLRRIPTDTNEVEVLAQHIRNEQVFTTEDHKGNILTDHQNNRVVGLLMEFEQIQYPIVDVGEGKPIEYYQFRTRITRRALE